MILDKRFLNVAILGLSFMLVFTAFQTMGNIEVSELDNYYYNKQYNETDLCFIISLVLYYVYIV